MKKSVTSRVAPHGISGKRNIAPTVNSKKEKTRGWIDRREKGGQSSFKTTWVKKAAVAGSNCPAFMWRESHRRDQKGRRSGDGRKERAPRRSPVPYPLSLLKFQQGKSVGAFSEKRKKKKTSLKRKDTVLKKV